MNATQQLDLEKIESADRVINDLLSRLHQYGLPFPILEFTEYIQAKAAATDSLKNGELLTVQSRFTTRLIIAAFELWTRGLKQIEMLSRLHLVQQVFCDALMADIMMGQALNQPVIPPVSQHEEQIYENVHLYMM